MTTPPYELRVATDADRPPVYRIYGELFRGDIERIWGWDETWQRENFAAEWGASETRIIEVAGRLAGYIQRQFREDHDYLLSLGLIPEMQGRGLGSSIMRGLQKEAGMRGLALRLSVFRTEPRRLPFYQGLGFRVTETAEAFWRLECLPGEILGAP
ncbi:MAG: hypothetical protein JWO82_3894 [Akkermansiaceae bacterium]|nr:hypothetical protein [Akkermansiaceae bacterium]